MRCELCLEPGRKAVFAITEQKGMPGFLPIEIAACRECLTHAVDLLLADDAPLTITRITNPKEQS